MVRVAIVLSTVFVVMLLVTVSPSHAQTPTGTEFTYRGTLERNGIPFTGDCNFEFTLYDMESNGTLIAGPEELDNESVSNGLFVVTLDFGSEAFDGSVRYLEIEVECPAGDKSNLTTLSPRQLITASPYSLSLHGGLDSAYDSGAAINADNGPVEINGTGGLNVEGNVGIGTKNPQANLHISTDDPAATTLDIENTTIGGKKWRLRSEGSSSGNGVGNLVIEDSTGGTIPFAINSEGNVGIGTTSPDTKFVVSGAGDQDSTIRLENSDNTSFAQLVFGGISPGGGDITAYGSQYVGKPGKQNHVLDIATNGTSGFSGEIHLSPGDHETAVVIKPNGTVGIGTISPDTNTNVEIQGPSGQVILGTNETNLGLISARSDPNHTGDMFILSDSSGSPLFKVEGDGKVNVEAIVFPNGSEQTTAAPLAGPLTQNLNLSGNWLSGDGDDEGVFVDADGNVGIGTNTPGNHKLYIDNGTGLDRPNIPSALHLNTSDVSEGLTIETRGGHSRPISVRNENSDLLTVSTDGHVGIGTDNSQFPLYVLSDATSDIALFESSASDDHLFVHLKNSSGEYRYGVNKSGEFLIDDVSTGDINRFIIDTGGQVGIGTGGAAPSESLVVGNGGDLRLEESSAGSAAHIFMDNTETQWQIASDSSPDEFAIRGGSANFTMLPTGNVGIGTSSPVLTLEIRQDSTTPLTLAEVNPVLMLTNDAPDADGLPVALTFNTGDADGATIGAVRDASTSEASDMFFNVRRDLLRTEAMRIKSDGNVGIGTQSPGNHRLFVDSGTGGDSSIPATIHTNTSSTSEGININTTLGHFSPFVIRNETVNVPNFDAFHVGTEGNVIARSLLVDTDKANVGPIDSAVVAAFMNGTVGIGTSSPNTNTNVEIQGPSGQVILGTKSTNLELISARSSESHTGPLFILTSKDGVARFKVENDGEVIVNNSQVHPPDYVFEDDYPLKSLDELREFVTANKHLPNVPSSADIANNGLNVTEFQMQLLEKTEELVLYTLQQEEGLATQKKQIEALQMRQNVLLLSLAIVIALFMLSKFTMSVIKKHKDLRN